MATISITKDELLKRLRAAKVKADREDARITKKHEQEEAAALKKFRDRLQSALRWDYATAKKHDFEAKLGYREIPACPTRNATAIARAIAQLEMDSRANERLNLGHDHEWMHAAMWLPESERPKASVCD